MDWYDFLFFVEVLVGGLLSGVMYSLVAIGFVLIYKTSGVLNFAQGAMVLFAALTFVSLVERGFPFAAALVVTLAAMVALGFDDRARRAAAAGQPLADDAVHGDARPVLRSSRARRSSSGAPRCTGSTSASTTRRSRSPGVFISSFDLVAAADRRRDGGGADRLLPLHPHRPRLPRRRRRPVRGARGRPAPAADLGARSGPRPASSRWSPGLLWGARLGVQFSLSLIVLEGAAGAGARRLRLRSSAPSSAGSSSAPSEKLAEVYLGDIRRRRHRGLVRLRRRARRAAGPSDRPVRPEAGREGLSHGDRTRHRSRATVAPLAGPAHCRRR